jgi:FkbM family methyltransferase
MILIRDAGMELQMNIGGRDIGRISRGLIQRRSWSTLVNMLHLYERPLGVIRRYLLSGGRYPHTFRLRSPKGSIPITAYTSEDLLTINEVFCRHDYPVVVSDRTIVDFGSNIGVSAFYFLTYAPDCFVYCHEPLPTNCERLRKMLQGSETRYNLQIAAITTEQGHVDFAYEPTGRYGAVGKCGGGVNVASGTIEVDALRASDVIADILEAHDWIDLMKIDIEGLERNVLLSIPRWQLERIDRIYAEVRLDSNPLSDTHDMHQYGEIAQFRNKNHRRAA